AEVEALEFRQRDVDRGQSGKFFGEAAQDKLILGKDDKVNRDCPRGVGVIAGRIANVQERIHGGAVYVCRADDERVGVDTMEFGGIDHEGVALASRIDAADINDVFIDRLEKDVSAIGVEVALD